MKRLAVALGFVLMLLPAFAEAREYRIMTVDGIISGFTTRYLESALEKTPESGVLVMKLDTPGGLLEATRDIVQIILESDVPVVTFVSPQGARAGSAGTFIVVASAYAAMAEGTNIGAAHPVSVTGDDIKGDMREKITNDTVAFIRSIAETKGRNADLAVRTVTESASLTAIEALEGELIDAVVNTDEALVEKLAVHFGDDTPPAIVYETPSVVERIAFFLSNPNVLVLLLMIGILAIYLEIKIPGTWVFAGLGATAFVLFLMGINIIPVNWLALLLIFAGIALVVAEVFIPSFGLLTLSSVLALAGGMYLLFSRDGNLEVRVSIPLIIITVGAVLGVALLVGRLVMKDFFRKPTTGKEGLKGRHATVVSWDGFRGKVFVNGEYWNAEGAWELERGAEVLVGGIGEGMRLVVEPEGPKLPKDSGTDTEADEPEQEEEEKA